MHCHVVLLPVLDYVLFILRWQSHLGDSREPDIVVLVFRLLFAKAHSRENFLSFTYKYDIKLLVWHSLV